MAMLKYPATNTLKKANSKKTTYLGMLDTEDGGLSVVYDKYHIIAGGCCNNGMFPEYVWKRECANIKEDLMEFCDYLRFDGVIS